MQSSGFLRRPQNLNQSPTWFDVYLVNVKSSGRLFQIFVAFSEYLNFMKDFYQTDCLIRDFFSKAHTFKFFFMSTIHKIIPVSITLLPPPPLTQLNSKKRREQKMFIMGSFHVTFVPPFHSMMKTTTNVYSSSQTSKEERMLWNTPLWTTNTYYYHTWNHLHPALTRCAVYVAVCFAW